MFLQHKHSVTFGVDTITYTGYILGITQCSKNKYGGSINKKKERKKMLIELSYLKKNAAKFLKP